MRVLNECWNFKIWIFEYSNIWIYWNIRIISGIRIVLRGFEYYFSIRIFEYSTTALVNIYKLHHCIPLLLPIGIQIRAYYTSCQVQDANHSIIPPPYVTAFTLYTLWSIQKLIHINWPFWNFWFMLLYSFVHISCVCSCLVGIQKDSKCN